MDWPILLILDAQYQRLAQPYVRAAVGLPTPTNLGQRGTRLVTTNGQRNGKTIEVGVERVEKAHGVLRCIQQHVWHERQKHWETLRATLFVQAVSMSLACENVAS